MKILAIKKFGGMLHGTGGYFKLIKVNVSGASFCSWLISVHITPTEVYIGFKYPGATCSETYYYKNNISDL